MLSNGPGSCFLTMTWMTNHYVWLMSALFVLSSPGSTSGWQCPAVPGLFFLFRNKSLLRHTFPHIYTGHNPGLSQASGDSHLGQQSHRLDQVGYEKIQYTRKGSDSQRGWGPLKASLFHRCQSGETHLPSFGIGTHPSMWMWERAVDCGLQSLSQSPKFTHVWEPHEKIPEKNVPTRNLAKGRIHRETLPRVKKY